MRNLAARLALLTLVLSLSVFSLAQDTASVTGVVTDSTGAVVPGASVVLTNTHTGVKFTQTTDSTGSYRFPNVPPDPGYTLTFAHSGFADVHVTSVALTVGITQTQNAHLVAGASQEIEVAANNAAVTLNTTDATIGNNIDIKLVNDLPIYNRVTPTSLFTLQPGYAAGSFAGARTDQNEVTVDGMDANNVSNGQNLAIVANAPVDSVQEFRGTVAGLITSQGTGSGGQFQLVTKNGTNSFHGNLNEYHRDTVTAANTWFNNNSHLARTPLIRNQFGGNVGGPILKDKLFFFFDFLNDRIVQSLPQIRTVPMPSYLAGNLNYINNSTGCNASARLNTTPNCISTLNSAQVAALDPLKIGFSAPLLTFLNARYGSLTGGVYDPTGGDGVNTEYYRFNAKEPQTSFSYVGRFDFNLTSKQHVFARFTIAHENATQTANFLPADPFTSPYTDRSYSYVVSHVWEIGQTKVNQFYYGDTVDEENFGNLYNPPGTTSFSFTKYVGSFLSGPYNSQSTQERRVPVPEFRDDFNWQVGHHNITFGGTFKFIKTNSQLVNDLNFATVGLSPYTAISRAQAPANLYLGANNTTSVYDYFGALNVALGSISEVDSNYNYNTQGNSTPQDQGTRRHYRFFQTELYAGDTWKVTPHLTLDYGVRYQLYSVPYETTGFQSVQNLTYQQVLNARVAQSNAGQSGPTSLPLNTYRLGGKANNGPSTYSPSYKDLAPRFAFSYNPAYSPKTVINGSAGIVYDRTVINAVDFIQDSSSQLFQQTISNPQTNGYANPRLLPANSGSTIPTFINPNPPGQIPRPYTPNVDTSGDLTGLANNVFVNIIDPNLKTPYSINYNFGIQQEFPAHFIMRLNYVGRLGRRLLAQADAAQLIDFPDKASGQSLNAAVSNLENQIRAGATYQTVKPVPWFEDIIGSGGTAFTTYYFGSLLQKGDFADTMQGLAAYGVLPTNVALTSQWAGETYYTNGGFSTYNGLLFSLSKNLSQGLQFDFNYTWSHSMDNTSQVANSIASGSGYGFLCDVLRPRECRANSDFDVTNAIRSDFVYDLPVGRHRMLASSAPIWLDEIIGGWSLSGVPQWTSGVALTTSTTSYVAGYANNAPALLIGNRNDLRAAPHKSGSTVLGFAACPTPQACGNLATTDFAYPTGFTIGSRNSLRGPGQFSFDAGLAKKFTLLPNDRLDLRFRADFFNVLNHPVFSSPNTDISQSTNTFGAITSTVAGNSGTGARVGQFALVLEF